MVLALDVTLDGDALERAVLAISGAGGPLATVYTANWSSGLDGWAGGTDGAAAAPVPGASAGWLVTGMQDADQYVAKTLSSLTSGHRYRVRATVAAITQATQVYFEVVGMTGGDPAPVPPASSIADWREITYEFTGTAASHVLRFRRAEDASDPWAGITLVSLDVTRIPTTGIGVTVQRTDANGTHYVRQLDESLPDGAGNLTLEDEEFALIGPVTWTVRDANGALASDTLTMTDYALPLLSSVGFTGTTLPIDRLQEYEEGHDFAEAKTTLTVIGRADPLVLERADFAWSLRRGRLTYHASSYDESAAIQAAYMNGRVALLRQPTHEGLDLYHVASRLLARPAQLTALGWRWLVDVEYQEVSWPEGALQGVFGWAYADVSANYLAYYNLPLEFATYADLAAGP